MWHPNTFSHSSSFSCSFWVCALCVVFFLPLLSRHSSIALLFGTLLLLFVILNAEYLPIVSKKLSKPESNVLSEVGSQQHKINIIHSILNFQGRISDFSEYGHH